MAFKTLEEAKKALFQEEERARTENLIDAIKNKNDEFYTTYEEIEREIAFYEQDLVNKTIFLPCDDVFLLKDYFTNPDDIPSQFWVYFHKNFKKLKLKKIVATSKNFNNEQAIVYEYDGNGDDSNVFDFTYYKLNNDGDFRHLDNFPLFINSDIVITNPPFSIKTDFLNVLRATKSKFLFIGHMVTIGSNQYFKLFKQKKLFFGFNYVREFFSFKAFKAEKVWNKGVNCFWFTNIEKDLKWYNYLTLKKEREKRYWNYVDNYPNLINIEKIIVLKEVQQFHNGLFAVPVTACVVLDTDNEWEVIGKDEDGFFPVLYVNNKQLFKRIIIKKKGT
ncbi:adenine-specific methyltransferase EcoRI family protein [Mesomycoplasma lagogenitalium]|uniref:Adenine-specific methyltransferase EcoRI family protein n=1 Tax=Mesomycoplasma lagogenitalium TaxID=171286 RepID=A0ABY8LT91_9BACT|nr:adenine-specific methyltransferase EcoRI family protein [Mesomycoplasma lagogenitalium]WGI36469.1 adenine-specific methyltransferase EcoRI family protein [Mesomycoplasma lagogenitalium]